MKPENPQTPSVGRIVHYRQSAAHLPRAALIVGIGEGDTVHLVVWDGLGYQTARFSVEYGENTTGGCDYWEWPTRV